MRLKYISRPVQVTMILVLLLFVFLFLHIFIPETVRAFARPKRQPPKKPPTETEQRENLALHSQKEFTTEQKLHQIFTPSNQKVRNKEDETVEVYDADTHILWEGKRRDIPYKYLPWSEYLRGRNPRVGEGFDAKYLSRRQEIGINFSNSLMIPVVDADKRILQRWRYEPNKRYFTGLGRDGRKIGYAGANGIKNSLGEVEPFGEFVYMTAWYPKESFSPEFLWMTTHKLYQINFNEERIETLFDVEDSEAEHLKMLKWRNEELEGYRPVICIVTKDKKHHMLFRNPEQRLTLDVSEKWKYGFSFTATMDKIFIRYEGSDTRPTPKVADTTSHEQMLALWKKWRREHFSRPVTYWKELYEVDGDGNMKFINRFEWVRPARPEKVDDVQIGYKDLGETTRQYLTATSPVICWPVKGWYYRNWEKLRDSKTGVAEFIREILWYYLPDNLWANVVFSLLMVCLAFWHGWPRRTGWVRFGFWLLFVGVFNLAGLLTYLALNHTAVIRCGVCGKTRGLERTDCAGCKAELVMPKGRETDLILTGAQGALPGP